MAFNPKRSLKSKSGEKALIIHLESSKDYFDLLQIAKAEGRKILKCKNVKVSDVFRRDKEDFIVVVQNADVAKGNMKR